MRRTAISIYSTFDLSITGTNGGRRCRWTEKAGKISGGETKDTEFTFPLGLLGRVREICTECSTLKPNSTVTRTIRFPQDGRMCSIQFTLKKDGGSSRQVTVQERGTPNKMFLVAPDLNAILPEMQDLEHEVARKESLCYR